LFERGFGKSNFDPCLFRKEIIICVEYLDDTNFAGSSGEVLEAETANLGT